MSRGDAAPDTEKLLIDGVGGRVGGSLAQPRRSKGKTRLPAAQGAEHGGPEHDVQQAKALWAARLGGGRGDNREAQERRERAAGVQDGVSVCLSACVCVALCGSLRGATAKRAGEGKREGVGGTERGKRGERARLSQCSRSTLQDRPGQRSPGRSRRPQQKAAAGGRSTHQQQQTQQRKGQQPNNICLSLSQSHHKRLWRG